MRPRIDINCDMGEGIGNDAALMPYISSCNIACGGHAGDIESMWQTVLLAKKHQVKVGAHPSFPDTVHFGRKRIDIPAEELLASIVKQITALQNVCKAEGVALHHIKAHGALYNLLAKDTPTAEVFLKSVVQAKAASKIYTLPQSHLAVLAERTNEVEVIYEAFIDRRYQDDLSLVPRSTPGAVIHEPEVAWEQFNRMLLDQEVMAQSGKVYPIKAATFCIHGDHPNAVNIVRYIHQKLKPDETS